MQLFNRRFRLKEPLASGRRAREEDVLNAKRALGDLGYYRPQAAEIGVTPWPDDNLFQAVGRFQRDAGLTVDRVTKPGGPTERALDAALLVAGKESRPDNGSGSAVPPSAGKPDGGGRKRPTPPPSSDDESTPESDPSPDPDHAPPSEHRQCGAWREELSDVAAEIEVVKRQIEFMEIDPVDLPDRRARLDHLGILQGNTDFSTEVLPPMPPMENRTDFALEVAARLFTPMGAILPDFIHRHRAAIEETLEKLNARLAELESRQEELMLLIAQKCGSGGDAQQPPPAGKHSRRAGKEPSHAFVPR